MDIPPYLNTGDLYFIPFVFNFVQWSNTETDYSKDSIAPNPYYQYSFSITFPVKFNIPFTYQIGCRNAGTMKEWISTTTNGALKNQYAYPLVHLYSEPTMQIIITYIAIGC